MSNSINQASDEFWADEHETFIDHTKGLHLNELEIVAQALSGNGSSLNNLTIDQLRALLAYHYWKDGAEEDFVVEVWKTDPVWNNRGSILRILTNVFGYQIKGT